MTGTHANHALHAVGRILAGQPAGGLSDRELLRRFAAARDEGAFAALVHRHGPMVLATCRRILHNVHDAEDVFQAALVWELRPAGKPLAADAVKAAWADLASGDSAKAYRALQQLAASPAESVPFLKEALPVARADEKRIARLVAELDSDDFDRREKATAELETVGELAVPALRAALAGCPSAELRLRGERLLAKFDGPAPSGERLRAVRAVEALEQADGREARDLLRQLAGGAEGARLTREVKAALERLTR